MVTVLYIALAHHAGLMPNVAPLGDERGFWKVLALAIMGLMGATVSALTSAKSISSERVPLQQAQTSVLLGRFGFRAVVGSSSGDDTWIRNCEGSSTRL